MRPAVTNIVSACLVLLAFVLNGCGGGGGGSSDPGGSSNPDGGTTSVLKVGVVNPRYLVDSDGRVVYLAGSHTWFNLQDGGDNDPPAAFNWARYLSHIKSKNHNFFRLWAWEQAHLMPDTPGDYFFSPSMYKRTGPGIALDGKPKFDLTSFNEAYFQRMRSRIAEAKDQGIYVSIMLFNGFSVEPKGKSTNPWPGHPFNQHNNINAVNGDTNGDGIGIEIHHGAISELQKAYIQKVVDTVGDLPNVLYEICNECDAGSSAWQGSVADYIRSYESTRGVAHPIGMTVNWPDSANDALFRSDADFVSPGPSDGYDASPPASTGAKVVVADTDHIFGVGGDRAWVWKSFTRGLNVLFMDPWNSEHSSVPGRIDPAFTDMRNNLGYTKAYADRMNLAVMAPHGELASTGYALANPAETGAEYLIYLPSGGTVTVNLSSTSGNLSVEWLNPASGATTAGSPVAGGAGRSFKAPFSGDAVLYLHGS